MVVYTLVLRIMFTVFLGLYVYMVFSTDRKSSDKKQKQNNKDYTPIYKKAKNN